MLNTIKTRLLAALTGFIVLLAACTAPRPDPTASTQTVDEDVVILANGNILTMNPDQPAASAMAVKEGKIIAVGDLASVKKTVGKSYEYVDLGGKTVVPGFIESHEHLVQYGGILAVPDISPMVTPSVKEALEKLKKEGKPNKDGYIPNWRSLDLNALVRDNKSTLTLDPAKGPAIQGAETELKPKK